MSHPTFVIVGAGQAGGWAARTLRSEGFGGRLVLIGDEKFPPYERPPLSKQVLLREQAPESAFLFSEEDLREQRIEMVLGRRVTAIRRQNRELALQGGEILPYDRLLIATGSRVRKLQVPGADLKGVHYLRAIPDTLSIREGLGERTQVLIGGGGWIGLEVASAARKLGASVTVVEAAGRLCSRALAPDLSAYLQTAHEKRGIEVRCSSGVESFEGDGVLKRARLCDGTVLKVSTAVVGIGILPNSELAERAGLEVENGILVDELCRTSDPHIFAAGDVTNHPNPLLDRRVRLESWENAQNQAIAAARSMLERGQPYSEIPWFWSDQFDLNIQLAGLPQNWDQTVVRGDPSADRFTVFYLKNGQLQGAAAVNNARDLRAARMMMSKGISVSAQDLKDESVNLRRLLRSA